LISQGYIRDILCGLVKTSALDDRIRVSTHVLYPSNGAVTVSVLSGQDSCIVSDDGGALSELISCGISAQIIDPLMRPLVRNKGLHFSQGSIVSPSVPFDAVGAAILLVANASRTVAEWGIKNLKNRARRNFRADLDDLLKRHFSDNLVHKSSIVGANKSHNFDYVVNLSDSRKLLVAPVLNDASSINSAVVTNLDVRLAERPDLIQVIVFDDAENWTTSNLKLLEMGARTLPFSQAEVGLQRLATSQ